MKIPEERCAHIEVRDMTTGRATCPDCGAMVDVASIPVFTRGEGDILAEREDELAGEVEGMRRELRAFANEAEALLADHKAQVDGLVKDMREAAG